MRRLLICLISFATLAAAPATAERIGLVQKAQPDSFQAPAATGHRIDVGDAILRDARVYTKTYGSVMILLADGTDVLISPNSSIVMDSFVYAGDGAAGAFAMTLAKGALRVISGRMRKESYSVETPVAQIGIRGTRYWLDVDEPGITKIWIDEGTVVARPRQTDEEFVFPAPAYAECTLTTCAPSEAPPQPEKFPTDPRRR